MRRRRHRLQVSTFPFLAVLLCAMGSLILLLLVLDRRAKVVARAKERARQEAVLAQHSRADQDRVREYEQKRQELRNRLHAQEAALHAKVDLLQEEVRKKKQQTLEERNLTAELQSRLGALREVLAREQAGYEQEKQQSTSLSTRKRSVLSEQEALARELVNLENALADVIAFRKRQAQTYSLVPFLGKSGENRRPIYVECQSDQIIVHPERLVAKTSSWDGSSPAQELAEKLSARLKANSAETKQKPYVLFLIRPEGIATYYGVLGALGVQSIDSGYELIDADWALDFGESDGHSPSQPWAADPRTPAPGMLAGKLPASPRLTAPPRGVPQNGIDLSASGGPGNENRITQPAFGVAPADGLKGQPVNGYGSGAMAQQVPVGQTGTAGAPASAVSSRIGLPGQAPFGGPAQLGYRPGANNLVPGTDARSPGGALGQGLPNVAGSGGSAGGAGPASLGNLLRSQDGSGSRAATNERSTPSVAGGGSSSPPVPGGGVSLPGSGINTGESSLNTGDSRVSFAESGQKEAGGSRGEPKLLPLPGSNDRPGLATTPSVAGFSGLGTYASSGSGSPSENSNPGPGGYVSSGVGLSSSGPVGGSASSGAGVYSPKLPNPGAGGEIASSSTGPAGNGGAGQPGNAPAGDLANNLSATGVGAPSSADAANQPGAGLSVEVQPGGGRPARVQAQEEFSPSSSGGSGSSTGTNQGSASGDATGESAGAGGPPGPPDPLAHLLPKPRRAAPPAVFRLEGNRDLPIVLECRADEVVMPALSRHWQVADLERDPRARLALAETVQQWIVRRQATVRDGQTPYRPAVRFRVNPDGLRTYYAAYPALEKLGFPMKRENVEAQPPPVPRMRPE